MASKIIILAMFAIAMVAVGVVSHKKATDVNSFVLGGRSIGPWMTAFSYGTSYFSAVIFIGYAGQFGWKFGIASTWIGIGNALIGSLLAWVLLGRRTRLMSQHINSRTMPQFFGKRYNSKALRLFAAAIIFVFLIPYTASLFNGLSRLFEMAFGVDYTVCVISMSVLTAIYVVAGGYMASSISDFIQGIIMLFGIVAVIAAVLSGKGGFTAALSQLANVEGATSGVYNSFFGAEPFNLLCVVILTSLGTWGLPQMVQKFYAIKDERAIKKGTIISTLFAVVVAGGCYFLGGFGRIFTTQEEVNAGGFDSIIPKMLENLPDILMGVVVILVLSASMSTLSSLVLTSSSTLTLDLIKGNIVKKMSEKRQMLIMRVMIAVFIIISAAIAIIQYKFKISAIADLMGISWGAIAGAFLAPFIYGLYMKRSNKVATATSFAVSMVVMLSNLFFRSAFPVFLQSPVNCGAFVMLLNLVLFPIVAILSKKTAPSNVESMFECFEETVLVRAGDALGASRVEK